MHAQIQYNIIKNQVYNFTDLVNIITSQLYTYTDLVQYYKKSDVHIVIQIYYNIIKSQVYSFTDLVQYYKKSCVQLYRFSTILYIKRFFLLQNGVSPAVRQSFHQNLKFSQPSPGSGLIKDYVQHY